MDDALTEANLRLWTQIIMDQKNSGMSIDDYCEAIEISRNKFYYWQRKIRKTSLAKSSPAVVELSLAPASNNSFVASINNPIPSGGDGASGYSGLQMYVNGITLNISADTSMELLQKVLEVIHA